MSILFDTKPLVVNVTLATIIGLNEAIILQQIHYWVDRSSHKIEGRKWIYNSVRSWAEQFPFWSEPTIKRAISSLEKRGLLISGKHNRDARDQTKWYTIDYRALNSLVDGEDVTDASDQIDPMEQIKMTQCNGSKWNDSLDQNDPTITRDYTETTAETTTETTLKETADQPPRPDQPYADYPETAQPETANPTQTRTDFKEEFKEIASIDENKQTRATLECAVTEVFDHWREKMNHPRAALDPKRKRLIKAALKNYDVKSLKLAIDGCSVTPHNIGMNDRGQRYDGLHIILRDADQIDRFIHNAYNPPKLKGRQARTEAINRQAMEEFLSGEHDPFASGTTTIEGEVIRHA